MRGQPRIRWITRDHVRIPDLDMLLRLADPSTLDDQGALIHVRVAGNSTNRWKACSLRHVWPRPPRPRTAPTRPRPVLLGPRPGLLGPARSEPCLPGRARPPAQPGTSASAYSAADLLLFESWALEIRSCNGLVPLPTIKPVASASTHGGTFGEYPAAAIVCST